MTTAAAPHRFPPVRTLAIRLLITTAIAATMFLVLYFQLPTCHFARVTGHPCPGCGLSRASLAIIHLDLGRAFDLQPFAFVVPPMMALFVLVPSTQFVLTGKPSFSQRAGIIAAAFALGVSVAMFAFWAARFYGFWGGPVPV